METKEKIREPYLLQRLKKPYKVDANRSEVMKGLSQAFCFGGGMVRGGISKDAWTLLNEIWRYDYMGSSEFEWGAVPKSLEEMVKLRQNNNLIKFEISVTGKINNYSTTPTTKISKEATVYVVCNNDDADEIKGFITTLADDTKSKIRTKE